jgi:hypothetical protein
MFARWGSDPSRAALAVSTSNRARFFVVLSASIVGAYPFLIHCTPSSCLSAHSSHIRNANKTELPLLRKTKQTTSACAPSDFRLLRASPTNLCTLPLLPLT